MTFGEAVSSKRKSIKLSQEEPALRLGVARQTVSSWERDVFLPDGASLIALSKILNCLIDDLVGDANPQRPSTPRGNRDQGEGLEPEESKAAA